MNETFLGKSSDKIGLERISIEHIIKNKIYRTKDNYQKNMKN